MTTLFAKRSRRTRSLAVNYVILTVLICFSLLPLLTMVFNSVKSDAEANSNPLGLPMKGIRLQNYIDAWNEGHLSVNMLNSVFLAGGTIAGVIVIAGMAAYSLSKLNLPGALHYPLPAGRDQHAVPALHGAAVLFVDQTGSV